MMTALRVCCTGTYRSSWFTSLRYILGTYLQYGTTDNYIYNWVGTGTYLPNFSYEKKIASM